MRKTFTIWLLLGALLLSLFGNVLVVSAQAVDQVEQEDTKLTVNSDNSPKSDEEQQLDSEVDDPQLEEDKKTTGEAENGTGLEVTDPVVDQNTGSSENEQIDEAGVDAGVNDADANLTAEDLTYDTETDTAEEKGVTDESSSEEEVTVEEERPYTPVEGENTVAEDADADTTDADVESEEANSCDDIEADESFETEDESDNESEEIEETAQEDAKQDKQPEEKVTPLEIIPQVLSQTKTGRALQAVAEITVKSFAELANALESYTNAIINIGESFEIAQTLTIRSDQNITLTAENKLTADGKWTHIEQPADYANWGEEKQREIIEEARRRGDEALEHGDLNKNPLPNENENIILKRAGTFLSGSLFKVLGTLTLGTPDTALYVDDNKDVQTAIDGGVLFEVEKGGDLTLKNGVLMHVNNGHGYSAPVRVNNSGTFTMDGGRISSNSSYERIDKYYTRPTSGGAVYVNPGGTFNLNKGLIDHNTGFNGAVFAGDLFGSDKAPATINMKGGEIVNNDSSKTASGFGGGIALFPKSELNLTDGIIAGNKAYVGGGIVVNDGFISHHSSRADQGEVSTAGNYTEHLKKNKAEANIDGGLIYANRSDQSGGGIYVESDHVNLGTTMLLNNHAGKYGGGIYVSFVPVTQKLDHVLITENMAIEQFSDLMSDGGTGGGLWNCPYGIDHLGEGHSIYIYDNAAKRASGLDAYGADISLQHKIPFFLDGKNILNYIYSHISPVTEYGNLIKFIEDGRNRNKSTIPETLSYTSADLRPSQQEINLKALYDDVLRREAWRNSYTFIMGNVANNGGGVGSNANIISTGDKGSHNLLVKKDWDISTGGFNDHMGKDERATMDIFIVPMDVDEAYVRSQYGRDPDLIKYGEIRLSDRLNWQSTFHGQQVAKVLPGYEFDWTPYLDKALPKDRGVYFTPEMLKARGLKYLVMERGDDYVTTVVETPESNEIVEQGKIRVSRHKSADALGSKYNGYFSKEADIYLYHYDEKSKRLDLLTQGKLSNNNNYTVVLADELLKGNIHVEYYGEQRDFYDFGKSWHDYLGYGYFTGYYNSDMGYALILVDNPDGSKTLKIPYLWIQYFDENKEDMNKRSGLRVELLPDRSYKSVHNDHTFTVTNFKPCEAEVQKKWDEAIDLDEIPDAINFILLLDGEPVVESYDIDGNPVYKTITLTKKSGWKGSLNKLNPLFLDTGRYSIKEEDNPYFEAKVLFKKESGLEDIEFWIKHQNNVYSPEYFILKPELYYYYNKNGKPVLRDKHHLDEILHEDLLAIYNKDNPVRINVLVDGNLVETRYIYWKSTKMPGFPGRPEVYIYSINNNDTKFTVKGLNLGGYDIIFSYYDVLINGGKGINEWGLPSYDILLERNERGQYTLRLPRLIYNGIPYIQFDIMGLNGEDFNLNKIPHTIPASYCFEATNYPKPPEEPPYEPPTLRFSKPTLPPPTTSELIRLLPATSCVQADAKPATKSATELVEKVWSELKLDDLARDLLAALRKAA